MYKGDEKIKTFIWDLITPTEDGEVQKISRDHSGLHNLVPRGRNAKGMVIATFTHTPTAQLLHGPREFFSKSTPYL